ncbi:MAG: hypothetical protein DRG78_07195 [Epsilonproteobacteria bacterium]|nr:MAG: hypothetical protein DRG78_07195 [Campylobacterota bacterium]
MSVVKEYEEALERLINNVPQNVPKNGKINNDTVALEANRKRGAIKAKRGFDDLMKKIENAENEKDRPLREANKKIKKIQKDRKEYRELYEGGLARELMLIKRIKDLEIQLEKNNLDRISVANNSY